MANTSVYGSQESTNEELSSIKETNSEALKNASGKHIYTGDGYSVEFSIGSQWNEGYNANITITNTGDTEIYNWIISFDSTDKITNIWNAVINNSENNNYIIKNAGWNQNIKVGQSISFGFTALTNGDVYIPQEYKLVVGKQIVANEDYDIKYMLNSDWGSGYNANITINNKSTESFESWTLEFDFNRNITSIWNGKITSHEENHYVITAADYNQIISADSNISFGFNGDSGDKDDETYNATLSDYTLMVDNSSKINEEYAKSIGFSSIAEADSNNLYIKYSNNDTPNCVTNNLELPKKGCLGSEITWSSSYQGNLSNEGIVSRPDNENTYVTLTAFINDGKTTVTKEFNLKVIKKYKESEVAITTPDDLVKLNGNTFPEMYYNKETNNVYYIDGSYTSLKIESFDDAIDSLKSVGWMLGIDSKTDTFEASKLVETKFGSIYRLNQLYKGIPVYSNGIIIETDLDGNTKSLRTTFESELDIDINPQVSQETALNAAIEATDISYSVLQSNLYITQVDSEYKLTWIFTLGSDDGNSTGKVVIIDANNGNILYNYNNENTASSVQVEGEALPGSTAESDENENGYISVTGTEYSGLIERTLLGHSKYELNDLRRNITIYDAQNKKETLNDVVDSSDAIFSNQSAVTALYNFEKTYDYYLNVLGSYSFDNGGANIKAYINSAEYVTKKDDPNYHKYVEYVNASFNNYIFSSYFRFGSYNNGSFVAGLDVTGHEYTHGAISSKVNLSDTDCYSGAINEAYADVMGCIIEEQCGNHSSDDGENMWLQGEHINGRPDRNIISPYSSNCPVKYLDSKYWTNKSNNERIIDIFVHNNSTVISHAIYLISETIKDYDRLANLVYNSMGFLEDTNKDFSGVHCALITAAKRLGYSDSEINAINTAFYEANISPLVTGTSILSYYDFYIIYESRVQGSYDVSGNVYDSYEFIDGNKVAVANAIINIKDNENIIATSVSDLDGNYSIQNVPEGSYIMECYSSGYSTYSFNLTIANANQNIDIFLDYPNICTLSGIVTEADPDMDYTNDNVLSGVKVNIKNNNEFNKINKTSTTDSDGKYSISELSPGLYTVTISYSEYYVFAQTVKISKDSVTYYNATIKLISKSFEGNGSISGNVYDSTSGKGISGLTMNVRSGTGNTEGDIVASYTTESNGYYNIEELPTGYYSIEVVDNRILSQGEKKYITNTCDINILGGYTISPQNIIVSTSVGDEKLRIVLTWGSTPSDLDSHLIGPTGSSSKFHISYVNKNYTEGSRLMAELDLDDTSSYGPETTTIYKLSQGVYYFYVHNFSSSSLDTLSLSGAKIDVYLGNTIYTFYVPKGSGRFWNAFAFDSISKRIIPINTITTSAQY